MTTIITGRFQQQDQAQEAIVELVRSGFSADQTTSFFVNPPGQHDRYPIGGDEDESPGTQDTATGALSGAAVGGAVGVAVGLATLPILGLGAAIAGAGAGAYAGSLVGGLRHLDDATGPDDEAATQKPKDDEAPRRKSGMLVAVCAPASAQQASAIRVLRARGAADIEQAEGTFTAGQWSDFNPLTPVTLVAS
jgi:hypothetical protein